MKVLLVSGVVGLCVLNGCKGTGYGPTGTDPSPNPTQVEEGVETISGAGGSIVLGYLAGKRGVGVKVTTNSSTPTK